MDPWSCSLLPAAPCPAQDSAGPAAGGSTHPQTPAKLLLLLLCQPHPPQRGQDGHQLLLKRSKKQNQTPCAEGWLCSIPSAPRGAGCCSGQFGVRMSFSERGDKKHLQPQAGQSLAVFGDRAGHAESCQLTPPVCWDRGLPCPLPGNSPGHS